jgi:hypothetical protein
VPLRVHNGATLATVTFWFTTATHTGVPTSLPLFRVHQIDVYGNITALGSGTVGDGFEVFHPTPNLAQWNNGGNPQSYTLTCVPNVIIDTSQFFYFAEIIDEAGNNAVAGNIWLECVASFTGIADMRPQ